MYEHRCCHNSHGKAIKNCQCLNNNEQTAVLKLSEGKESYFHWRLADLSYINVPDYKRPNITFILSPCSGSMHLFVKPLDSNFSSIRSKTYWYKSTNNKDINEIHLPLLYSDYYVVVYAKKAGNFSMFTTVSDYLIPRPGHYGNIEINQTKHYSMEISFYSPPIYINNYLNNDYNIGELVYTIYYFTYDDVKHEYKCENSTDVEECYKAAILWTPCGLERSSPNRQKKLVHNNVIKIKQTTDEEETTTTTTSSSDDPAVLRKDIKVIKHSITFDELPLERDLYFNILIQSKNSSLKMAYRGIKTSLHFDRINMQVDKKIIDLVNYAVFYTIVIAAGLSLIIRFLFQYMTYLSVRKELKLKFLKDKAKEINGNTNSSKYVNNNKDGDDDEEKKDPDDLDDHANSNRLSNENIQTGRFNTGFNEQEYVFSEDGSTPRSPISFDGRNGGDSLGRSASMLSDDSIGGGNIFSDDEEKDGEQPLQISPAKSEEEKILDSLLEATSPDKD